MAARTGAEFLEGLRANPRELWVDGELVEDVTGHPAFARTACSIAGLYDLQHEPERADLLTCPSPASGERVATSFLQPRDVEELRTRGRAFKLIADVSCGMLGRSPDFMNTMFAGLAAARDYFAQDRPDFGENIVRYYEYIRENDLSLTHTLINPQSNRSKGVEAQADPYLAAGVVRQTDNGFIVRGARMLATLAPFADEIAVFPSSFLQANPASEKYAFAFSIPCSTPGLKLLCREPFSARGSEWDHPLSARFEEMDAVVVFDDVEVPWERTFLFENVPLCNGLFRDSHAIEHMMHQSCTRMLAKAEFVLGVASLLAETIAIDGFMHVQEKLAEIINAAEILRACVDSAERSARPGPGGFYVPCDQPLLAMRSFFPTVYPRLVEILQLLGASGLMMTPTHRDLESPAAPDIEKYYQAAAAAAPERIQLFRLAWEIAGSTWGSRQVLYERFFSGDPVRLSAARFMGYDTQPYKERVRQFLDAANPSQLRTQDSGLRTR